MWAYRNEYGHSLGGMRYIGKGAAGQYAGQGKGKFGIKIVRYSDLSGADRAQYDHEVYGIHSDDESYD